MHVLKLPMMKAEQNQVSVLNMRQMRTLEMMSHSIAAITEAGVLGTYFQR